MELAVVVDVDLVPYLTGCSTAQTCLLRLPRVVYTHSVEPYDKVSPPRIVFVLGFVSLIHSLTSGQKAVDVDCRHSCETAKHLELRPFMETPIINIYTFPQVIL